MNFLALVLLMVVVSTSLAFVRPTGGVSRPRSSELYMGGKQAKFGIFSPAVYGAKFVLGEAKLKSCGAVALHSQHNRILS